MLGMPQKWLWYIGRHKLLFVDKDKEWDTLYSSELWLSRDPPPLVWDAIIRKKPNQPIPLLVKPSVQLTFNFNYLYHHIGITVYAQLVSDRLINFWYSFYFGSDVNGDWEEVSAILWHVGSPFPEASRISASGICFSSPRVLEHNHMKFKIELSGIKNKEYIHKIHWNN